MRLVVAEMGVALMVGGGAVVGVASVASVVGAVIGVEAVSGPW